MNLGNLFAGIVNMSVTACLVILAVLLARLVLKKAPKIFSYALWLVVLLRLLCPVSVPLPSLPEPEPSVPVQAAPSSQEAGEAVQNTLPLPESEITESPVQIIPQEIAPMRQEQNVLQALLPFAGYVWLTGAAAALLLGIVSTLCFRRRLRGSCRLRGNIYLVDHLESAFVTGLFSPKIYLPSDLSTEQLRYIVAHERHHIARLDHVVKHLFYFALCLHWFNPLVWLAFSLMSRDMEMSCDEAVLKKLGDHIRAEYSASLLQLAMGHTVVAGSPLCFGEGDAKGRIRNLARWRQPKKWQSLLSLTLCAAVLTACAASPVRQVVKPQELSPAVTTGTTGALYEETFQNIEGTTTYHIRIDPSASSQMPPAAEALPRPITSADMERVAKVLLGDVPFYERESSSNPQYSRQQYQQMLNRWQPYLASEEMMALFGADQRSDRLEALMHVMESAEKALSSAPEENPLTPCDWTLKKERVYNDASWEINGRPLEEDGDWLVATAEKDGLGYTYMVIQEDRDDYRLRRYLIQLGGASLYPSMDRKLAWAKLCRTQPPTEQQLQDIQRKVLDLLASMDFGDWAVSSAQVEADTTVYPYEYKVRVRAVPVIFGANVVLNDSVTEDSGEENGVISYLSTKADFLMSPNGELLDMELDTPIDIKTAPDAPVLSFDQLMETAQQELSRKSFYLGQKSGEPFPEPLTCNVYLDQISYCMISVEGQAHTDSMFYSPRLLFHGKEEYCGTDSGEIYYSTQTILACPGFPAGTQGYVMSAE